jgi:hypothetical protein
MLVPNHQRAEVIAIVPHIPKPPSPVDLDLFTAVPAKGDRHG